MSKHREEISTATGVEGAVAACERSFHPLESRMGWQRIGATARTRVGEAGTVASNLFKLTNPVTIEVAIIARDSGSQIELDGGSFGWGPIQGRHVTGVVRALASRVQSQLSRAGLAAPELPTVSDPGCAPPRSSREPSGPDPDAREATPAPRSSWGKQRVFVSYRRDDTGYVTDAVCDRLATFFGREALFKDIDSIPLGVNFREYLTEAVQRCDVLLALIGRDWLEVGEDDKTPRLHEPRDFVRIEIEAALARKIPVIPVLVRNARLPKAELLPESLRELPYFNGTSVRREPDFDADVERLRKTLADILSAP